MNRTDGRNSRPRHKFESQDDFGYLTGRHTKEDNERQIRTPERSQRDGKNEEARRRHQAKDRKTY